MVTFLAIQFGSQGLQLNMLLGVQLVQQAAQETFPSLSDATMSTALEFC